MNERKTETMTAGSHFSLDHFTDEYPNGVYIRPTKEHELQMSVKGTVLDFVFEAPETRPKLIKTAT